ncbi:MAG TPA: glycoside hydrolase family 75 protein [Polyangiaceae bacterium]|nr:glycoside hydrolase family 75 protein [Polyangiaceae bacterium]
MRTLHVLSFFVAASMVAACGSDPADGAGGAGGTGSAQGGAASTGGAAQGGASSQGGAGQGGATSQGGAGQGGGTGAPTAAELLAKVANCDPVSTSGYKTDDEAGLPANIDICGLPGAVFWKADMDVDCDGKETTECNLSTDPAFYPATSATDSNGDPLDAAALPFVVIPLPSSRFDYSAAGIELGAVVAVIYDGKVEYGVFGDEGPNSIIGEASYAMASSLGIDPDPSFGGVDSGVTYIVFTGSNAVVSPIESHDAAVTLGQSLASSLLAQ